MLAISQCHDYEPIKVNESSYKPNSPIKFLMDKAFFVITTRVDQLVSHDNYLVFFIRQKLMNSLKEFFLVNYF